MFLIVGLGNPGNLYERTRHNAGFMAVDFISNRHNFSWSHKSKFNSDIATGVIGERKTVLCKPTTFMNLSGNAVASLISYYKIEHKNLIVIHDDIDLDLGELKCKIGGSSAGHNGLKSIDEHIGNDYLRVRIGVGKPDRQHISTSDYVLSRFGSDELLLLESKYQIIAQNIELLFTHEIERFKGQIK
jgi:PTH1 family peptidyl-tRNA hydrolase